MKHLNLLIALLAYLTICLGFRPRSILHMNGNIGLSLCPTSFGLKAIGMPRVLNPQQGSASEWLMWFHGRPKDVSSDIIDLSTGSVYLASSKDGLSAWKLEGDGPCLTPGKSSGDWWWFDSEHVGLGDVITPGKGAQSRFVSDDGVYLCYFFGGNSIESMQVPKEGGAMVKLKGCKMEIGVAVSQDGLHWSKVEGDSPYSAILEVGKPGDFDADYVGWPFVLEDGSAYKMYYHTFDTKAKKYVIGLANSKDGIKWKKVGVVFSGGQAGSFDEAGAARCFVAKDATTGSYKMWYEGVSASGTRSIGLAVSINGVKWTREKFSPVFEHSSDKNAWDAGGVGSPHLVFLESQERWRLYYVGCATGLALESSAGKIGVAESTDKTGTAFIRQS